MRSDVRDLWQLQHAPLLSAPVPAARFSKIPALHRFWVQPLFLSARIFEHAPPARG
jgi:hypothetical protein